MNDCIFVKLSTAKSQVIKSMKTRKSTRFRHYKVTKGHTLMIPKQHVADIFEYNDVLASDVFARIPKVARALEKAFPEMEGLNILNNNKEVAYQSVFHSHVHLIPRYSKEDDFSIHFGNHQEDYSAEAMQEIAETIASR